MYGCVNVCVCMGVSMCACVCALCVCVQMISTLESYVILWPTVSQFYDKFSTWMTGPFYKLVPEEVENDTSDAFRCVCVCVCARVCVCTYACLPIQHRLRARFYELVACILVRCMF